MAQNPHHLLPPSKRFKVLNSEPMPQSLPTTNEHHQMSLSLPAKKRFENVNCPSASASASTGLIAPSGAVSVPTKKRTAVLNRSSTSAFLPVKKRTENLSSFSTTVCLPAKKRVWVPPPLSPDKSDTQAHEVDSGADEKGGIKDGGVSVSTGVPVKKRAWARILLSPTKTETEVSDTNLKSADVGVEIRDGEESNQLPAKKRVWIDLNTVQENDQINEGEEVRDISATNLVSAIKEVTVVEHLLSPALVGVPREAVNPEPIQQKDPVNGAKVKEIHGGKKWVLAPNPLSANQGVAEKERVQMEKPITPAFVGFGEKPTNLKPLQENNQIKPKEVKKTQEGSIKKQVSAQHPSSDKKKVWKDLEQDKENCGLTSKKRVWAPNPSSLTKMQNQAKSDLKYTKEKGFVKVGKSIPEALPRKKVRAPLSPIPEENDQTVSKRTNEIGPVLAKKLVWTPEPLVPTTTHIKQCTDPKPIELSAENEFEIKDGDTFLGVSVQPLSPAKTETQIEEKGSEFIEDEVEDEVDDGVLCAVCQSTDGEPSDPIVFCDGCDLMVHASCYGNPLIKSIPEGDWFCSVCSSKSPKKEKRCCLCPSKGGALKPTVDGKWAHVMCALLVPEVFFQAPEGRDGIDCSRVPQKRWQKDCFICGRSSGCAIDCAESKCKLGFHVSCGLEEGLCIEYREGKGADIVAGFCTEHTKLWQKQQLTGKFRIVSSDQDTKRN